jgi:hypothetical protein
LGDAVFHEEVGAGVVHLAEGDVVGDGEGHFPGDGDELFEGGVGRGVGGVAVVEGAPGFDDGYGRVFDVGGAVFFLLLAYF